MTTTRTYRLGETAQIKFQGMEQGITIVSGPRKRNNGFRDYDEYEINLDELDDECPDHDEWCSHVIEVAAEELF